MGEILFFPFSCWYGTYSAKRGEPPHMLGIIGSSIADGVTAPLRLKKQVLEWGFYYITKKVARNYYYENYR
jgi:hypothetical protein